MGCNYLSLPLIPSSICLWDVTTCPWTLIPSPWYLLLAHKSSYTYTGYGGCYSHCTNAACKELVERLVTWFYPRPPTAPQRIFVVSCPAGHPSVCLSQHLSVPNNFATLFKDFSYQHKIWWDDAQYHEADCPLKWPCSTYFACSIEGIFKFSMICLDQVWGTLPLYFSYWSEIYWDDA